MRRVCELARRHARSADEEVLLAIGELEQQAVVRYAGLHPLDHLVRQGPESLCGAPAGQTGTWETSGPRSTSRSWNQSGLKIGWMSIV